MLRLHQQLESLFKYRINSNEEIIPFIKKLSEAGKLDGPKQTAVFAIILDRLGRLEDIAQIAPDPASFVTSENIVTQPETGPVIETQQPEITPETPIVAENASDPVADAPQEPETPAEIVPVTSSDAPQQPEQIEQVQTPIEVPPVVTEELKPVATEPENQANGTISEFSLDAITDTPEVDPATSA